MKNSELLQDPVIKNRYDAVQFFEDNCIKDTCAKFKIDAYSLYKYHHRFTDEGILGLKNKTPQRGEIKIPNKDIQDQVCGFAMFNADMSVRQITDLFNDLSDNEITYHQVFIILKRNDLYTKKNRFKEL